MALIDDFKTRFTEFDTVTVDLIFPSIEPIWPCYFCGDINNACDKEAILNLLAHLFVGEEDTGAEGPRTEASSSVGSVSSSYEQTTSTGQSSDFFRTTKYGQRFLQITSSRMGARFL